MHDRRALVEARIRRHLAQRILPAATSVLAPLEIAAWPVPGDRGPGSGEPVARETGLRAAYQRVGVGTPWGPPWGTTWFRLTADVQPEWRDRHLELVVDLGWTRDSPGGEAEALAVTPDGVAIKGLHPRNDWLPATPDADGRIEVYLEAAANPSILVGRSFAPTPLGDLATCGSEPLYRLARADLVEVHDEVRELARDLDVLLGLTSTLDEESHRGWQVLLAMDAALDALDLADVPGSAAAARAVLAPVLAAPAAASAMRLSAVGHAHIDSAWLWPVRETRRKVVRTVANVLRLVEDRAAADAGRPAPLVFALPAAQHCAWLEADQPELFARLREAIAAGWVVPVGGMWVEPDANLVGAESVCRQLTFGARFFADRFGHRCEEIWLPDSFGYSGALPQIARLAGMRWFLTQKISWNQVDRFPHHTFLWEGIDGSRILTHFPSADTYNSDLSAGDLAHASANFADKGRSDVALVPFGYGDGGGGPTREMLARAERIADLEGSPRVVIETPAEFFEQAQQRHRDPAVWTGELYLELHRATFTSQARTKAGNRRCEHLLREAELWAATAALAGLLDYPYDELDQLWQLVLLGQFHDILPGSSIAWVHDEVEQVHGYVAERLEALIDTALDALCGDAEPGGRVRAQATPWLAPDPTGGVAMGAAPVVELPPAPVTAVGTGGHAVLDNGRLRVGVDHRGLVTSLVDLAADRELVPPGAAAFLLQTHPDLPNAWDAWDVDRHYLHTSTDLDDAVALEFGTTDDGGAQLRVERRFGATGASRAVQTLTLAPRAAYLDVSVHVDWHERDTFLKLAWPVDVHTDTARFETQFGHVTRPTHDNTSWDHWRFEVPAHRWVHVGEPGYGLAIANARTYGWDVSRHARPGGGSYSTLRASLLRGPQFPDPMADEGEHDFTFRIVPGASVADAVRHGYAVNHPPRDRHGHAVAPLVRVVPDPAGRGGTGAVVIETVKLADDRSGDLVVRAYEPLGARATARLVPSFPVAAAWTTDLHEQPGGPHDRVEHDTALPDGVPVLAGLDDVAEHGVRLTLRPFQIVTLRLRPQR